VGLTGRRAQGGAWVVLGEEPDDLQVEVEGSSVQKAAVVQLQQDRACRRTCFYGCCNTVDGRILMNQSCTGTGHCVHTAAGGWVRVRFTAPPVPVCCRVTP
jgi:hypothetical protein